jgi:hypothetical protein
MTRFRFVLLLIAVLGIYHYIPNATEAPEAVVADSDNLYIWFAGYNDAYFGDKLPRDPVISHEKIAPGAYADMFFSASEKRFHIRFNSLHPLGERFEHLILQHEMCHIETFDEDPNASESVKDHGPRWRACMLRLETNGAWRSELIDGYKGD